MARTRSYLVAGIVGLALTGMTASPASAVTVQPVHESGAVACPAPVGWSGLDTWSAVLTGAVDPDVRFQPSDDVLPEHQARRCADGAPDRAPGLDDGRGWLLWRGPDWGIPSLGTFA